MSIKEKIIELFTAQIGYRERADGWTKYGQWYTDTVIPETGLDFSRSDWCVMGQTWIMRHAGVPAEFYPDTSPQGSSVGYNLAWMEQRGWRTPADDMPRVLDLVYYHWPKSSSRYDHIGLCIEVSGKTADDAIMRVGEFNYNDTVGVREIAYRDARVVATVRIPWEKIEENAPIEIPEDENRLDMPELSFLLKQGSKGQAVEILQAALIGNGYDIVGGVDGYFGAETKKVLISYQRDHGIISDGTAGTETFGTLLFG